MNEDQGAGERRSRRRSKRRGTQNFAPAGDTGMARLQDEQRIEGSRRVRKRRRVRGLRAVLPRIGEFLPSSLIGGELLVAAMLFAAFVLGGGGSGAPETEVPLECALALMALLPYVIPRLREGLAPVPAIAWVLAGLVLVIPLAQLVPLPPSVWQSLPGRGIEVDVLRLVGADQRWMPISMAPTATLAAFLAMVAMVLVMLHVARLDVAGRTRVMGALVVAAGLSLVLGALQMAHVGGLSWTIYREFHHSWLIGFDANRNAETDFLQIAILAVAVLAMSRLAGSGSRAEVLPLALAGFVVLAIAVALTGSRGGLLLFPLTAVFFVAILWKPLRRAIPNLALLLGAGAAVLGIAAIVLSRFDAVQRLIGRFDFSREARWDIWIDTFEAARRVWPIGSGVGTFSAVVQQSERLEVVDQTILVRAHNDWLEWLLEAGAPGLALLAVVLALVGWQAVSAWRSRSMLREATQRTAQILFALGALCHIGLHGIVDYPTRSMALASLIAFSVGMLLPLPQKQQGR